MIKEIIFLSIVIVTVLAAFMAVSFKKTLYNAFSLMLCLGGIAGIFVFLSSEFLAVMEIVVYVGAIAIAIIFAIMFSPPHFMTQERKAIKMIRSILAAGFFFFMIYRVIQKGPWIASTVASIPEADFSIKHLGSVLLGVYTLPFEIISVILFIAVLGALIMGRRRGTDE